LRTQSQSEPAGQKVQQEILTAQLVAILSFQQLHHPVAVVAVLITAQVAQAVLAVVAVVMVLAVLAPQIKAEQVGLVSPTALPIDPSAVVAVHLRQAQMAAQ
jgi:hypothetical protein